jgi:hypothetical protein
MRRETRRCGLCILYLVFVWPWRYEITIIVCSCSTEPPFFSFHSCYFGASKLTSLPIPGWIAQLNYHDWHVYVGLNFNLTTTHRTRFVRGADRLFWQKFLIPHYQVVEVNLSTLENSFTCPVHVPDILVMHIVQHRCNCLQISLRQTLVTSTTCAETYRRACLPYRGQQFSYRRHL